MDEINLCDHRLRLNRHFHLLPIHSKPPEKADGRHLGSAGIRIAVVEKRNFFEPGFPFSDEFVMACHMTNTCAEQMGIEPDDSRDFKEWPESESGRPESRYKALPKTDAVKGLGG
jgi:hypothetical protein